MMKKTAIILTISVLAFSTQVLKSQNRIQVFDTILFYDGYNNLDTLTARGEVIAPVPEGTYRLNTATVTTQLTDSQLNMLAGAIRLQVTVKASCDNYDRLGHVHLSLLPKDSTSYLIDTERKRIEIARFVTPFMNKNLKPDTVPYQYQVDYLQHIFQDSALRETYNYWVELDIFGVPYAANTEIRGCAGRNDVFFGSLTFVTTAQETPAQETDNVFIPLFDKQKFTNKEGGTDTIGKTIRSIEFTLDEDMEDAQFVLITSNHGAGSGGEEYNRRWHYVRLNGKQILTYRPGRETCEPFRRYNTQGNGIYGRSPLTNYQWQSFSNWCPGDVIDTRIIKLDSLKAGNHVFTIEVPDAKFTPDDGGNFPLSLYFQGKTAGKFNKKHYVVRGRITDSSTLIKLQGVDLENFSPSTTNSRGEFSMIAHEGETLVLRPSKSGYLFDPVEITCENVMDDVAGQDFVYRLNSSNLSNALNTGTFVNVYPNPAATVLNIERTTSERVDYQIFNLSGQLVLQGQIFGVHATVDIASLARGGYQLKVGGEVIKIVKE